MLIKSFNQKGLTPIVLLFIAAIGLIAFFVIASATPFKDDLFNRLFPKPPSKASSDYFPLGVFEADNTTGTKEKFADLIADSKKHGLDSVMFIGQGPLNDYKLSFFDISDRENFNVIFSPSNPLHTQWFDDGTTRPDRTVRPNTATYSATIENARLVANPILDKLKTHPSVKGYYLIDEPEQDEAQKRRVALMTQAFREADNTRPAFPLLGVMHYEVTPIFDAVQPPVLVIDVYPFRKSSVISPCNINMYSPYDFVSYIREVSKTKPVNTPLWIVLQAFGPSGVWRLPSPAELRLESWLSIGEGAKGIFYFIYSSEPGLIGQQGWTGLKDNPALFDEVKTFAQRIGPLKSTLLGLHRIDDTSFSVSGNNYVSTLVNSDGSKKYLVVVNKSCNPQNITVNSTITGKQLKNLETNTIHSFGSNINFEGGNGRIFEVVTATPSPPSAPSPSPSATPQPTLSSISGRVYKDDNKNNTFESREAFPRAIITATSNNFSRSVTTSSAGYYIFRNLPTGNYSISITQPNPLPTPYSVTNSTLNISVNKNDSTDNNFRLIPNSVADSRIFITNEVKKGNLGGLDGANAFCQSQANAANLGGTWKAWLSSSTKSAAENITTHSNGDYKLVDGTTVIAHGWSDLTKGTILAVINKDQYGGPKDGVLVWTNTTESGLIANPNESCNNWNSTSGIGGVGHTFYADKRWSVFIDNNRSCDTRKSLICIEQK